MLSFSGHLQQVQSLFQVVDRSRSILVFHGANGILAEFLGFHEIGCLQFNIGPAST